MECKQDLAKNVPEGYEILCCEVAHDNQNLPDKHLMKIQKDAVSGLASLGFIKEDEIIDTYSFDADLYILDIFWS